MSKFNNDVLQAREIQNQYLAHNTKTKEVFSGYDPKTKCRYFKKVEVDPNAAVFKENFIKSKIKKEKPVNTKDSNKNKPGRTPKPKPEIEIPTKVKKKKIVRVNPKTVERRNKIEELSKEGKTAQYIADQLQMSSIQVNRHLKVINLKSKDNLKVQHSHIVNTIVAFCKKNKLNVFYTSYNKSFGIFPQYDIRQIGYRLKKISKNTNRLHQEEFSGNKNWGLCFRVFNNENFSDNYLKG